MAGMSLRSNLNFGASYGPLTPAAAGAPSARASIAQQAYGVAGAGVDPAGPRTAAYGSVALGMAAVGILTFIWWSLPR